MTRTSAFMIELVVVCGGAGKGGSRQSGVSAAAAALIDSVGAVVECVCVGAFVGDRVGVEVGIAGGGVRAVLTILAELLELLVGCCCWWWCHRWWCWC